MELLQIVVYRTQAPAPSCTLLIRPPSLLHPSLEPSHLQFRKSTWLTYSICWERPGKPRSPDFPGPPFRSPPSMPATLTRFPPGHSTALSLSSDGLAGP